VNSILHFRLKRGGDGTKRCQKMKRRQRAHLDSMKRKRDTMQWRDEIGWSRGGTEEEKGRRRYQLG
jgi:hypothetical protein